MPSALTKGRLDSFMVSPPGNFNKSIALSEADVAAGSEAGLGAIGLYVFNGCTEAMGTTDPMDLL